jgi:long-chain acyl-CoA synthetase
MYRELKAAWAELTAPGAQFEIREIELRGARIKTYANVPQSLRDLWLASTAFADREYFVYQDERWTYADVHRDVASVANWLRATGVRPGDRVAIAMRNFPEWMTAYWACVSTGITVVGVNAWWVGPELVYGLNDSTPKVLICDDERLARYLEHKHEMPPMAVVGVRLRTEARENVVPWSDLLAVGGSLPEAAIDPDSDACIFYTSGTTGHPKGAQLTHRGCVSNVMSMAFAGAVTALALQKATGKPPEAPPMPASLVTTPLFHVTANNCVAQGATLGGGKLVFMYKWDAGEALRLIEREKITAMSGVPTMARELISHPDFAKTDTSSLRTLGGGGAQLQPDLVHKIDRSVATARPNTGYGMTETCGIITSIVGDFFVDRPASAGPAMPCYDVQCVDSNGRALAPGEVGELWVKGAQVIRGYLNRPEASAQSITNGWLHTGDVARLDEDGFIYIVDRVKDMVIRGGENIYCAEVETAMYEHPAVAECTVFGVPDDRLGEEVGAAIVLKPGQSASADDLRIHCADRISRHKVPRFIWIRSEPLPRNASGKFLKRELRDSLKVADAR